MPEATKDPGSPPKLSLHPHLPILEATVSC